MRLSSQPPRPLSHLSSRNVVRVHWRRRPRRRRGRGRSARPTSSNSNLRCAMREPGPRRACAVPMAPMVPVRRVAVGSAIGCCAISRWVIATRERRKLCRGVCTCRFTPKPCLTKALAIASPGIMARGQVGRRTQALAPSTCGGRGRGASEHALEIQRARSCQLVGRVPSSTQGAALAALPALLPPGARAPAKPACT